MAIDAPPVGGGSEPTSEPEPVEPPRPGSRWKGWVLPVAAAALLLALALFFERLPDGGTADRKAILAELHRLERAIRNHEPFTWIHSEGQVPSIPDARETAQAQMLSDLDRLGHLEGFMMSDIEIRITGDTAVAFYTVEGRASPPPRAGPGIGRVTPEPVPRHAEAHLARTAQGWRVTAHRLW